MDTGPDDRFLVSFNGCSHRGVEMRVRVTHTRGSRSIESALTDRVEGYMLWVANSFLHIVHG